MKIEKVDGTLERRILTGMIVSSSVLGRVTSRWEGRGLFSSEWANLVGAWCVDFYRKRGEAPHHTITVLFEDWLASQQEDEKSRMVAAFLEGLSDEFASAGKEVNAAQVIDLAGGYFDRVRITRLRDQLTADLELNKVTEAKDRISRFSSVELGAADPIHPCNDEEVLRACFLSNEEDDLITFPDALGDFYRRKLRRGSFLAYMAPEKAGKTWTLIDLAYQGISQRRRVAYFEAGDQTRDQLVSRIACRVSQHPLYSPAGEWPCLIPVPVEIRKEKNAETAELIWEDREYFRPLNFKLAWKRCRDLRENIIRSHDPYLRLSCHPNSTLSTTDIRSTIERWFRDGWSADVVIIDYADILAAPKGVKEFRDQVNEVWKGLRALSQEFHCLVVTATQTNAASYGVRTLGREHYSNDKRKYAHVTALAGINVSAAEKELGLSRYNWIVVREQQYSSRKCVYVGGCLAIGCPTLVSCYEKNPKN